MFSFRTVCQENGTDFRFKKMEVCTGSWEDEFILFCLLSFFPITCGFFYFSFSKITSKLVGRLEWESSLRIG